jgi:hypothetical protein
VNLEWLFSTIAAQPAAFGYAGNATCLVSANTIVGGCADPSHTVLLRPKVHTMSPRPVTVCL